MATQVDTEEILHKGYLSVRQCVPPAQLELMRSHCEQMLERHKKWWADHRQPGEPAGGEWEAGIQPRVLFDRVADRESCAAIDFVFHENTYGISKQVMRAEDVAPLQFGMFCNPRKDCGPADWHRDIRPPQHGPCAAHFTDFLANSPCYTQWNIALYDDDVFWLVPGSHRRFNSEAENRQLASSEYEPIDGGMAIELEAGDGIVYLTPILHWGSNYSTKLRRTLQYTYRSFNNGSLSAAHVFHWTPDLVHNLPAHLASRFKHFLALWEREYDVMEGIFRAMIARDEAGFLHGLAELHAGEVGRMICVIYLSKIAKGAVRDTRGPVGSRFTREEGRVLWQRFTPFDRLLQVDEPYLVPGFQTKEPSTYNFNEIPTMEVDEFIASWDEQAEG